MTEPTWQISLPSPRGNKRLIELPATGMVISPLNPRRTRPEDEIDLLASRIRQHGYEITRAIWVHEVNEHYEVFAGGTRLEAAKRAGMSLIPSILHEGFSEDEVCKLAELDNENDEYHQPVPIVDVWLSYKALANAGWTQPRIARAKGCSQSFVSLRLALAKLPEPILRQFINNEELKERHALEIIKLLTVNNLTPWLTREQAMLEVIKKVGIGTAAQFAKKVKTYNTIIGEVQTFADGLEYQRRQEFLEVLAEKKVRTVAAAKNIAARITYAIAEAARRAEEDALIAVQEAERERIEAERKEREAQERQRWFDNNVTLIHGDLLSVQIEDESVDMIFTDPPYSEDSISLYGDLAKLGARVLKPGGSLICYAGHYALPEIFSLMTPHLRFWWTLACEHGGNSARLPGKWVFVGWKPMLWFVKEGRRDKEYVADIFKSTQPDKSLHEWQQDTSEAAYYIEHLTGQGDIVLDPFCGSGTTLVAAINLGRLIIGVDQDRESIETTRERLDEYYTRQSGAYPTRE